MVNITLELAKLEVLWAIESPKGRHAPAVENAKYAVENLCSVECRLDFP